MLCFTLVPTSARATKVSSTKTVKFGDEFERYEGRRGSIFHKFDSLFTI
jgi:hypothetical protein